MRLKIEIYFWHSQGPTIRRGPDCPPPQERRRCCSRCSGSPWTEAAPFHPPRPVEGADLPQLGERRALPGVLWVFALDYYNSAAQSRSRPGPPPAGGGPVHFSLDGCRAAEYPPAGANTLTSGAVWRGGVPEAFSPFPVWALTRGL